MTSRLAQVQLRKLLDELAEHFVEDRIFKVTRTMAEIAKLLEDNPIPLNERYAVKMVADETIRRLEVFQNTVDDAFVGVLDFKRVLKLDD